MIFGYRVFNESRREERDIKSQVVRLLLHMLKCKYQNSYSNKESWRRSIRDASRQIRFEFKGNEGSFKGTLYHSFYLKRMSLQDLYEEAVEDAVDETKLPFDAFPAECEWTKEQLIDSKYIRDFIKEWGQDNA